jgi:hypothetical protein
MKQWEASTTHQLEDLRDQLRREARRQIQGYQESRQAELERRESSKKISEDFASRITNFVKQKREGKSKEDLLAISESELRQEFEQFWKTLLASIPPLDLKPAQVLQDAEKALRAHHKDDYELLVSRKEAKSLRDYQEKDFRTDEYYDERKSEKIQFWRNNIPVVKQKINKLKDDLLARLKKELDEWEQQLRPYNAKYLSDFLPLVFDEFKETSHQLDKMGFSLKKECKADLLGVICGYAIRQIEDIDKQWREAQDPIATMEKEKDTFWQLFQTRFRNANLSSAVVGTLLSIIEQGIAQKIENDLTRTVIQQVRASAKYSRAFRDKQSLIASKMIDLADRDNFSDFIEYIDDPRPALKKWVACNVDEYNSNDVRGIQATIRESIEVLAETAKDVIKKTNIAIESSPNSDRPVLAWIEKFSEVKGVRLIIDKLERIEMLCRESTVNDDFTFPEHEIDERLENLKKNLFNTDQLNDFSKMETSRYQKLRNQVAEEIIDQVLGCVEACPFCGEICCLQIKSHDNSHVTLNNMHRPQGVRGWRPVDGSPKLLTQTCSEDVAGTREFHNEDTDWKFVPYRDYRTIYANWDIKGDPSSSGDDYWKWFMAKYRTQLALKRIAEEPDIPPAWDCITKEQATDKLRRIVDGQA